MIYISGDILTAARHPASLCITPPAPLITGADPPQALLITEADPPQALLSTGADPPLALLITRDPDPENSTIQQRGCQHICFNFNPKPEFFISALILRLLTLLSTGTVQICQQRQCLTSTIQVTLHVWLQTLSQFRLASADDCQ